MEIVYNCNNCGYEWEEDNTDVNDCPNVCPECNSSNIEEGIECNEDEEDLGGCGW